MTAGQESSDGARGPVTEAYVSDDGMREMISVASEGRQEVERAMSRAPRVLIVGGGFGGLYAARSLGRAPVAVTLVDRRNFHLFQPLLYQVATGVLSPGDIASPLRYALKRQRNARVVMGDVVGIDPAARRLALRDGDLEYDTLVIAAGVATDYFGRAEWERRAPGLKTIEDAVEIRRRVLFAFEAAEREPDAARRAALLTFVVVGGGPTGVELAGALAELAHRTLRGEFRAFDPRASRVILVEGGARLLPALPASLSERARRSLGRLGVETRLGALAVGIDGDGVDLDEGGRRDRLPARTVLWAAGVRGASLGAALRDATGCGLDHLGRVVVGEDLTVPGHADIFVIGDLAHVPFKGAPLPCIAQPAIQQGKYVAGLIRARLAGKTAGPFRYFDKGSMATIGRSAAVAEFRGLRFWGFPAWVAWLVIHLIYLVEFENRVLVLVQWANSYLTHKRGSRLIAHGPLPLAPSPRGGEGERA
jgi:NADH dehydrogenase